MATTEHPPNINFGREEIIFDTHPHEQDTFLSSYWTYLKQQLHTAYTGDVPPVLRYGTLRIEWWTHSNHHGLKDYQLHEFVLVKQNFDLLVSMHDEVRRVLVRGWEGQNPFVHTEEGRRLVRGVMYGKEKGGAGRELGGWNELQDKKKRREKQEERFDAEVEGRTGKLVDIEGIIEAHDRKEEERRKEEEGRIWKENEGLLSGGMV